MVPRKRKPFNSKKEKMLEDKTRCFKNKREIVQKKKSMKLRRGKKAVCNNHLPIVQKKSEVPYIYFKNVKENIPYLCVENAL